jgi:hypothetical protein
LVGGNPILWLCVTATLVVAAAATCDAEPSIGVTLGASLWHGIPSGTMQITEGGRPGSGSEIDLGDDLDLGAGNIPEGFVDGMWGRHRFGLAFEPLAFDGVTTARRTLEFHGATIGAGSRVHSDLALRFIVPRYDYGLIEQGGAELRAGLLAYVWTFDAQLRAAGPTGAVDERRRFTHALPSATLSGTVPVFGAELDADAAFGTIGSNRYAIDLAPQARVTLWNIGNVALGYRWLKFVFRETTNRGDLTIHGPYVSFSFSFDGLPSAR